MSDQPSSTKKPISRQRVHQLARRDAGLCAVEGCEIVTGPFRYYCTIHRREHRAAVRRRKLAKREKMLAAIRTRKTEL